MTPSSTNPATRKPARPVTSEPSAGAHLGWPAPARLRRISVSPWSKASSLVCTEVQVVAMRDSGAEHEASVAVSYEVDGLLRSIEHSQLAALDRFASHERALTDGDPCHRVASGGPRGTCLVGSTIGCRAGGSPGGSCVHGVDLTRRETAEQSSSGGAVRAHERANRLRPSTQRRTELS